MPTLIRLLIVLLVLAGLVYGAMLALVIMVKPADELVTIRIPPRELVPPAEREPLVQREIDTSRTPNSPPPSRPAAETPAEATDASPPAPEGTAEDGSVVTLAPGVE
jgi:cell division protein FtsN